MRKLVAILMIFGVGMSYAAGGLTVSSTGQSVTVTQGGVTSSVNLSSYKTNASTYASFSQVSWNANDWKMSGGDFTPASTSGTYSSLANVVTFVADVKTLLDTSVKSEVNHIVTLVNDVASAVSAYNVLSDTDPSKDKSTVETAYSSLTSEISSTKSAIDTIKALKFNSSTPTPTTSIKLTSGSTVTDYSSANIITTTGGTSTIGSDGAITFK